MERPNDNPRVANTGRRADEERIYAALFAVTSENAAHEGAPFTLPSSAFVKTTHLNPNFIDLSQLADLPDREAVYALFWALLKRVPTEETVGLYTQYGTSSRRESCAQRVGQKLSRSPEAHIKHVRAVRQLEDGLDRIAPSKRTENTWAIHLYNDFMDRVFDPAISLLYRIYSHTLRPIRFWFRERKARRQR